MAKTKEFQFVQQSTDGSRVVLDVTFRPGEVVLREKIYKPNVYTNVIEVLSDIQSIVPSINTDEGNKEELEDMREYMKKLK
jgi:hypothetical protein